MVRAFPAFPPLPSQDDIPRASPLREKRADPLPHAVGLSSLAVSGRDTGEYVTQGSIINQ